MISFPKAKINLGLSIVSRRSDGYHNLESVFYPIALKDIIEIVPASETKLFITGLEIPGEWNENLVVRAYFLLKIELSLYQSGSHLPFTKKYLLELEIGRWICF